MCFARHGGADAEFCRKLSPNAVTPAGCDLRYITTGACQASSMSFGHCLTEEGDWKLADEGIPIDGDEIEAGQAWAVFQKQFKKACEQGSFFGGPIGEEDIKYRFRRFRDMLDISSNEAVNIVKTNAIPLAIDVSVVSHTWETMVKARSRKEALAIVRMNPAVVAAGDSIGSKMDEAKMAAQAIEATRPMFQWIKWAAFL